MIVNRSLCPLFVLYESMTPSEATLNLVRTSIGEEWTCIVTLLVIGEALNAVHEGIFGTLLVSVDELFVANVVVRKRKEESILLVS